MHRTLWPSLLIAAAIGAVITLLPLEPRIAPGFFFAQDSKALEEIRIQEKRFGSQALLMVIARSPNIDTPHYAQQITQLSEALAALPGIITVRSLSNGPDDLADALDSPIWNRLLLYPDGQASNLILVLDSAEPAASQVPEVEKVLNQHRRPDFDLLQTGVPYVVHSIGSELQSEFRRLGGLALAVFALILTLLYRQLTVVIGCLMSCAVAATAALSIQVGVNGGLGLLTANLVTIAFVLTLLHAVFLINNVRQALGNDVSPNAALRAGIRQSLPVSAWCALTTLLGFASLVMVDAQPLRELGKAGVATTLAALASCYLILPLYLRSAAPRTSPPDSDSTPRHWPIASTATAIAVLAVAWAIGSGVTRLDTDPSMLDYFAEDTTVHRGLRFVDARSGTNPLNISVSWRPREALDRVAAPFVTADRGEAMYMLRMVEAERSQRRSEVIAEIHSLIRDQGFAPVTTGGLYALQAKLADAVTRSLVEGLGLLLLLFAIVAVVISRHPGASLAMLLCALSVPLTSLGLLGWWGLPLDIIATPAASVALGVASDALLHLAADWRRAKCEGHGEPARQALASQGPSIAAGSLIICAGFAVFLASAFPPTQRFGIAVFIGTAVAALMALVVLPAALKHWDTPRGAALSRSS